MVRMLTMVGKLGLRMVKVPGNFLLYLATTPNMKGSEPEWTNPKSSAGNCMNCAKMQ